MTEAVLFDLDETITDRATSVRRYAVRLGADLSVDTIADETSLIVDSMETIADLLGNDLAGPSDSARASAVVTLSN